MEDFDGLVTRFNERLANHQSALDLKLSKWQCDHKEEITLTAKAHMHFFCQSLIKDMQLLIDDNQVDFNSKPENHLIIQTENRTSEKSSKAHVTHQKPVIKLPKKSKVVKSTKASSTHTVSKYWHISDFNYQTTHPTVFQHDQYTFTKPQQFDFQFSTNIQVPTTTSTGLISPNNPQTSTENSHRQFYSLMEPSTSASPLPASSALKRKQSFEEASQSSFKSARIGDHPRDAPGASQNDEAANGNQVTDVSQKPSEIAIGNLMCIFSSCGGRFQDKTKLRAHLLTIHQVAAQCVVQNCSQLFRSNESFEEHIEKAHHNLVEAWPCSKCDQIFTSSSQLNRHYDQTHDIVVFSCTAEGCHFESQICKEVMDHFKQQHVLTVRTSEAAVLTSSATTKKTSEDTSEPDCFIVNEQPHYQQEAVTNQGQVDKNYPMVKVLGLKCIFKNCKQDLMKDEEQLNAHIVEKHKYQARCDLKGCGEMLHGKEKLQLHIHESHGVETNFECFNCDHTSDSYDHLQTHVQQCHHEGCFACAKPGCNFELASTRRPVFEHYLRQHQLVPY